MKFSTERGRVKLSNGVVIMVVWLSEAKLDAPGRVHASIKNHFNLLPLSENIVPNDHGI
jgi:hypothetical protein